MAKSKVEYWLTNEGLTLLEGWARDGLIDEQIAKNIGIRRQTLYTWKNKYSDINDALKKGKEIVDVEVENALLKRAMGYDVEIKEEKLDRDGFVHELKRTIHVAGDVTAQIYWLKNRLPDKWREKQKEKDDGKNDDGVVIIDDAPKWEPNSSKNQ